MTAAIQKTPEGLSHGGRRRHVQCQQCHRIFIASRSDARTCGARCRQRIHRRVTATAKCDEYGAMTPTELAALEAVPEDEIITDAFPWWDCNGVLH